MLIHQPTCKLLLGTYGCSAYILDLNDLNTGIHEDVISNKVELLQNYPNPFNLETTISFILKASVNTAEIEIFNIRGQKVKVLKIESHSMNLENSVVWNSKNEQGNSVASGTYFYRLKLDDEIVATRKMILLK